MKVNFARITAQIARMHGDREALVNIERGRRYTVREIHLLSNRIVNMMRDRLHLRRADTYLCILENDSLSLLHNWTSLKGEAIGVWSNFRDSVDEHLRQIDFIQPKVVFIENSLLDRYIEALRERGVAIVCMDPLATATPDVLCFWDLLEGVSDGDPGIESDVYSDVLNMRFTGGTTGQSKCAQFTIDSWQACQDSFFQSPERLFDENTRTLIMAPLSHASGMSILPGYVVGGCTVTQNLTDLRAWCSNVEAERITSSTLIPTVLYRLLELEDATRHDLSTLDTVYYGAAPMSPSKLAQLQARFGNVFVQLYGAAECPQAVAMLYKADHAAELGSPHFASAGRVMPGVEVLIVDDNGEEVADGERGEIWIRGRATISGYYRNPEATAREFQDGFWKSGDLGYRDAMGYLYIVDRKKDMIITGGFNVYAVEVENALNAHPLVTMSAVIGIPHAEWGEAVHAEVILKPDAGLGEEELIAFVKAQIGSYKTPKSLAFVPDLPLTPAQKVLRRAVRDKYWTAEQRSV